MCQNLNTLTKVLNWVGPYAIPCKNNKLDFV